MKKYSVQLMALGAALLLLSCDRERSNPIDPQAAVLVERPDTPTGLQVQPGVERVLLAWQAVDAPDLAGYAVFRSAQSNGAYGFLSGDGDSTLQITTGKVSFIDSLDAPGQTFFYRVAAVDTTGLLSELSNFVGATIIEDVAPPAPPANLSVVADETQAGRVVVRWTLPRTDADGRELTGLAGFVLYRAEGDQGYVPIDTLAADVQSYVDTGLKSLTSYSYRILSFDAKGNKSQLTTPQVASTLGLPTPANFVATGDISRIELRWNGVDNSDLIGYNVYRSARSDVNYEVLPSKEGTPFTTGLTAYVDSGLVGGTSFFYKVQAIGRDGLISELSVFVGATALADEVAPGAPADLAAVADEDDFGRVVISWNAPLRDADNASLTGLQTYTVYRSADTNTSFVAVGQVDSGQRQLVDTGLDESTTYFYAVTASDGAGNEGPRSSAVQVRTKGPDRDAPESPQNLSAIPSEEDFGRVVVRWNAPVTDADGSELTGLSRFVVFRSKGGNSSFVPIDTLSATTREYVDGSLEPLTNYVYTVSALDEAGNESARAQAVQVRTEGPDQVAPVSPQNLSALADENDFGRVTVSWGASTQDVGGGQLTGLTSYTVFRSKGSTNSFQAIATVDANTRQYVDTGLEELTTYYYTVSALDDAGNESARASFVQVRTEGPDQVAPISPQNLSAVADENDFSRVTVSWGASTQDVGGGQLTGLTGYTVFRSKGSTNSFQPVATVDANTRQYVDTGLEELTTYYYTVSAVDGSGNESARSSFVQVRTDGPDQVAPAAPQNLSAVADENDFGQVTVSWNASTLDSDGGQLTGLTGYTVFRSKGSTNSFQPVATVDANTRQYVDTGLEELTTYYYTVSAGDEAGNESARSGFVQVLTEGPDRVAPAAPQNLSAVADEANVGSVSLQWSAPTLDAKGGQLSDLGRYIVFRAKGSANGFVAVDTIDADSRAFVDVNLEQSTVYFYAVSAVDGAGNESVRSSIVQVVTEGDDRLAPAAPQNLAALADEDDFGRVSLNWSAPSKNVDGSDITDLAGYTVFRSKGSASSFQVVVTLGADVQAYVDTGLEELTTYYYTLSANDENGNESARASAVQIVTAGPDRVAPSQPQNISAVADAADYGRVALRWSAPTRDASGDELTDLARYVVFRSRGSVNSFVAIDTVDANTREYTDTGLEESTTYFYTLSAVDEAGNESSRAQSVQVTTEGPDVEAPAVPQNLSAIANELIFTEVVLGWNAPTRDADGSELTGLSQYVVFRSKGSTSSFVAIDTVDAGVRQYVDTGLEELTTYFYAISAIDANANESGRTNAVSVQTGGPDQIAPQAPADLVAVAAPVAAEITLSWTPPSRDADGGELTGLASYVVLRSKDDNASFVAIDTIGVDDNRYVDTNGLESSTAYYYALRAMDETGNSSARSSAAYAKTAGIDSPTGLTATAGIRKVTIAWAASSEDGLLGYNVYRSERSDEDFTRLSGVEGAAFSTGRTAYIDSNLAGGNTYFYRVSTVTEDGESEQSSFVGATVYSDSRAPAAPSLVKGESVSGDPEKIDLSWNAPTTDANGAELTGVDRYYVYRADDISGPYTLVATVTSPAYQDTGLVSVTTYYYQVEAIDQVGNTSLPSTAVAAITSGVDKPSDVRISASTPSDATQPPEVTIVWTKSEGAILHYELQRTTVANSTNDADFVEVGTNSLDTERIDDTVVRGTTYYYRVRARDIDDRVSEWTDLMRVDVKN